MADNIEYLILEQFRAMRNQIEGLQTEMRNEFSDVKHRISRLESAVAGFGAMKPGLAKTLPGSNPALTGLRNA